MKANLNSSQILCWNCEEIVHAYAARCPYCTKDLSGTKSSAQTSSSQSDKIAQIHPDPLVIKQELLAQELQSPESKDQLLPEELPSPLPDGFTILVSLAALLAGSFFLFFGIVIKLFSVNGAFTLEWKASSWPYFIGSSFVMLILGLYTLSKIDKE